MIPLSDSPARRRFPWVTIAIIAINVVVFVFELGMSDRQLEQFVLSAGTIPAEILSGRDLPPPRRFSRAGRNQCRPPFHAAPCSLVPCL